MDNRIAELTKQLQTSTEEVRKIESGTCKICKNSRVWDFPYWLCGTGCVIFILLSRSNST